MGAVNAKFAQTFGCLALGVICRHFNLVHADDRQALIRLIFNVLLPMLVLSKMIRAPLESSYAFLPAIGLFVNLLLISIGWLLGRNKLSEVRGLYCISMAGFNIPFTFPLVEALWGAEGMRISLMYDLGNAAVVFGVNFFIAHLLAPKPDLDPENNKFDWGEFMKNVMGNIPLLCFIIAIALNVTGVGVYIPDEAFDFISLFAISASPLVLFLLGAFIEFNLNGVSIFQVAAILVPRYIIGLAVAAMVYYLIPILTTEQKGPIVLAMVAPGTNLTVRYAMQYGYSVRLAGTILNVSILLSFGISWLLSTALDTPDL